LNQLYKQPAEEEKLPGDEEHREHLGLNQIQEMLEEDISEPTEFHHGEHNMEEMQYGPA